MKNKDYWTKRKANLIYEQMDKAEKQADKFDEIYKQAKAYLDKQINKVFDKFQRDYGLSERDARQVLKNMKDQKDLNELRKVLEARPNDPNIQRLLADLDSPAYAYRMKRLERLNDDLNRMRESIYRSEKSGSDAFYSDLMKDSYYKATFDLQQQTGLAYSFSSLPETEIKRLRALKWTGEAYSDRIWSNTGALASSVKDELLVSLMTGRSVRDTSQAIAERFNVGQNKARRLVRTESAFFHNQMELLSYEDAEITKYRFVAVLDKRTSHICQEHDNKVYDTDKAEPGVNYPPLHPWCRSTTIAHDEDADYSKLERRARNPKTGKVEYVPADMSYNDWYSEYVAKPRERELSGGKFGANLDYVRSDEFVDKLKNHPKTSNLSESIARVSRQILQHRNGTQYEDYYLLDAETGRVVALSNKARKIKGVVYNDQVRKAFKESSEQSLVSIHNHPSGYPPSLSDFASLQQRSKNNTVKYGLTIGHDGSVYWYSKPNKRIHKKANQEYENLIEKMIKLGYTEVKAQEKTLALFAEKYDFTFERID
ncbi:minor capsid protein [Streptococcus oralis]|uniref:minor capsid protein n=1 Tax=Streptococcus oralis TaxID=1303 RepID=UPI00205EA847|nr:minor capsid protein [Streptococcus oralis]MCY7087239.1 minor capsid protein [Streptococcus oralis]DAK15495.1 MAG TPA: minor capsid protein [Caudoviricetes sp.]DAY06427.1 MAG TPA: minor capsid protein [Caudoviricetes sp.]